ncbi:MAG: hypothetical protein M1818_002794 [Claussenomyces sp. TS43310]|nr:MAG: hypothetical protein M1818_002794 [Claussenomyces sp. TS43310]
MAEDRTLATPAPPDANAGSSIFSQRSRRQFGLFLGGAAFFGVASLITRRSLLQRYRATLPKFYHPSNQLNGEVNGSLEAVDALAIATVNVFSLTLMLTGGTMWACDISSVDELRQTLRSKLDLGTTDERGAEADREAEEWLSSILVGKEEKEQKEGAGEKGIENMLTTILARKVQEQRAKAVEVKKNEKDQ